uniref:Protein kinase domain-containing protein n=1 Tax=Aegilops tauschii subsp. strangulata TaxID=200361 RepID=A0A452XW63_AEGTS
MRLDHQNIVQLVGYCYETHHKPMLHNGETIYAEETNRVLCFEYMPNGSLRNHISGRNVMDLTGRHVMKLSKEYVRA